MRRWKSKKEKLQDRIIFILVIILGLISLKYILLHSTSRKLQQKQIAVIPTVSTIEVKEETKDEPVEEQMPEYDIKLSKELQRYTFDLCQQYNLSYTMVLALMYQESKFNIKAINKNNNLSKDEGLTQLNSCFSKDFASRAGIDEEVFDPYNPYHSIKTCIVHLRELKTSWVNSGYTSEEFLWDAVLTSYNRGISATKALLKKSGTAETTYSKNILKWKTKLENGGALE